MGLLIHLLLFLFRWLLWLLIVMMYMGFFFQIFFIDIMIEEANKESMKDGQFGPKTLNKILDEIRVKEKRNYSMK